MLLCRMSRFHDLLRRQLIAPPMASISIWCGETSRPCSQPPAAGFMRCSLSKGARGTIWRPRRFNGLEVPWFQRRSNLIYSAFTWGASHNPSRWSMRKTYGTTRLIYGNVHLARTSHVIPMGRQKAFLIDGDEGLLTALATAGAVVEREARSQRSPSGRRRARCPWVHHRCGCARECVGPNAPR
jgi:hypothetical protein